MKRYIERDLAEKAMMDLEDDDFELYGGVSIPEGFDGERAVEALREIPTADVKERKYAKLKIIDEYLQGGLYRVQRVQCDNCNATFEYWDKYIFCPFCGAELNGGSKDET